ncbi:carbohydrate ABC transporter permease [Lacticaseibacillus absianus]|uniref:carbohydrate ABC transporter permease n=1 Tax=Lacticaseibacillus absianus TaxID=2729623 RepID=UPI0015CAE82E|nr:carbohydrate ABC transporter permease [Lacticaseibacillus absianus]
MIKRTIQYSGLTLVALLLLAPLLVGLWASLLPTTDIAMGALNFHHLSLANYAAAIQTTPIVRYVLSSFVISSLITIGQLVLCSMAAYAFAFIAFRFKQAVFFTFLVTMMLPFEAQIIPNFQTIKALGWLNQYAGMTIPFLTSAFGVFMLRQAFLRVPSELIELGHFLGLSHGQTLAKLVLPYSRSMLVTFGLYTFLANWNQYLWPLITTFSDQYRPVQVGLKQLQAEDTFANWGVVMATAMLALVPTLLLLLGGQRFFKRNLNAGGVKG